MDPAARKSMMRRAHRRLIEQKVAVGEVKPCVEGAQSKCPECGCTLKGQITIQLHNCCRWIKSRSTTQQAMDEAQNR